MNMIIVIIRLHILLLDSEYNLLHKLHATDAQMFVFLFSQDENVRFVDKCDEALSHLLFAGSDIILCASFDDPILQAPVC